MSLETKGVFNQVTNLVDKANYQREVQQSKEIFDHQTTSFKPQVCYMKGQTLQGFGVKEAPASLIDMESYLRTQPYRNELDKYLLQGDLRNQSPSMPDELKTRLLIPDCADLIEPTYARSRQADIGFSRESKTTQDTHAGPKHQVYVSLPGIDTKMAMKDEYKKRLDEKLKHLYGPRADNIVPAPEIPCKAGDTRNCMHLFPEGGATTSPSVISTLQPSSYVSTYAKSLGEAMPGADTTAPTNVPLTGMMTPGPSVSLVGSTLTTQQVLASIPPNITLGELAEDVAARHACQVDFYDYKVLCPKNTLSSNN